MPDSVIKTNNISSLTGKGVGFPDGSSSNPGIKFTNDSDTGIYRVGPNKIGFSSNGNKVGEIGTDYGAFRGNVVQCRVVRYDVRTTVTTGTANDGVEIIGMRVSITPKFKNSMILCMFQVFGEGADTHDYIMRVFKNGVNPAGAYPGYNAEAGNTAWSGMAMSLPFESNYGSTPHQAVYYYHDFPNTINPVIYAPGVKDTANTSRVYYINRTVGSLGAANSENGTSFSIAWEIAQ
jgi:hypothetical protein